MTAAYMNGHYMPLRFLGGRRESWRLAAYATRATRTRAAHEANWSEMISAILLAAITRWHYGIYELLMTPRPAF